MTRPIPPEFQERLEAHLAGIAKLFRAPRITLVIRSADSGNTEGDLVLSNDEHIQKVIDVIHSHMKAEARRFAAEGKRSGQPGAEFPHQRPLDQLRDKDNG